jgi:prophage regulatory protein
MMKDAQNRYEHGQHEGKQEAPLVLMRIPQILEIMPISRATFCSMVKNGEFPKPIKIGRSSLWTQEQVQAYMRKKISESEKAWQIK